jgi:small-conductance mechanosensitive channel
MLLEAALRTQGLLEKPSPFVAVSELGDFAILYELNVYSGDPHAQVEQYTALHLNILDVFNEFGVQIMTPNYEADPETPKLVPPDQWFTAPAKPCGAKSATDAQ